MPLTQAEADHLLALAKEFVESDPLIYPYTQPLSYDRALRSIDRREELFLTVERGNRKRARLKYQTRGRGVIVLAASNSTDAPIAIRRIHHTGPANAWSARTSTVIAT